MSNSVTEQNKVQQGLERSLLPSSRFSPTSSKLEAMDQAMLKVIYTHTYVNV